MPNDQLHGFTVVASVYYTDDIATVLLLDKHGPPFFAVGQYPFVQDNPNLNIIGTEYNIVPAVEMYEDYGGDY
jgi:hypothetical protein